VDPIIVERAFDRDGDEYVHVYVVFDGEQQELALKEIRSCSGV